MIKNFYDLTVWQESHKLVIYTYTISKKFPSNEKYSMTDQTRRAAVSITSNIAEGFGRKTLKDKIHFYHMSHGSLMELKNLIFIAKDLSYIGKDDYVRISQQITTSQKLILGVLRKLNNNI